MIGLVLFIFLNCAICEEIIIETPDITTNPAYSSTGHLTVPHNTKWSRMRNCPAGSVVTGFKFAMTNSNNILDNSGGIQGVALQCSIINYWNNFDPVQIIFDGIVGARQPWTYKTNSHAIGFTYEKWTQFGSGLRQAGNWKFRFAEQDLPISFPPGSIERVREEIACPGSDNYAICGFSVLRNQELDRIVRFRFKCCYHCVPEEVSVVVYDFTNNGITDVLHTVTKRIGMSGGERKEQSTTIVKLKSVNPAITGETGNGITDVFPFFSGLTSLLGGGSPASGVSNSNQAGRDLKTPQLSNKTLPKTENSSSPQSTQMPVGPPSRKPKIKPDEQQHKIPKYKLERTAEPRDMSRMPRGPPRYFDPDLGRQQGGSPPAGGGSAPAPPTSPATAGSSSGGSGSPSTPSEAGQTPAAAAPGGDSGSGSSNFNLKAKFDAKFAFSKTKTYNWGQVSWSIWEESRDETDTLTCKALHRCVLKQLTGVCGTYQFHTPQFDFTHIPLRLDYFDYPVSPTDPESDTKSRTLMDEMVIDRPGENWIVLENLTFSKRTNIWDKIKRCPPGSVVTGQQPKSKIGRIFTGLNLKCSILNASSQYGHVGTMSSGVGIPQEWQNSTTEAIGGTFVQYEMNGFSMKQNFELRFQDDENKMLIPVPPGAQNVIRREKMCGANRAICAMQAMYDTDGEMTDVAFQCCNHCDPQERMVVLESFTNLGYTDTIQTVTRTVGNIRNTSDLHAGTNLTENLNVRNGINPAGLQAGFAAKFDEKIDSAFKWATTSSAFWTTSEQKTMTVVCKARMLCVMRQLMGICNDVEIPTPYIVKESFPLSNLDDSKLNDGPLRIKRNGENWMVAQNLTFSQPSFNWDPPLTCPSGTFVTGQQLKRNSGHRFGGLSLMCSRLNEEENFIPVIELVSGFGNKTNWYHANSPAMGFTFLEYSLNGTVWKAKWEVRFENDVAYHQPPKGAQNITRTYVQCPPGQVIMGMQTMFDRENKGELTNIGFQCSFFCRPKEKMVLLNAFTNDGVEDLSQGVIFTIGTRKISEKKTKHVSLLVTKEESNKIEMASPKIPPSMYNIFASRFEKSNNVQGFNWTETLASLWTTKEEKNMTIPCKAGNFCSLKQLIGFCGDFEILSPHIVQNIIPLNDSQDFPMGSTNRVERKTDDVTLQNFMNFNLSMNTKDEIRGREVWIMAQNLTRAKPSGIWEEPQVCPQGTIVTDFRLGQTQSFRLAGFSLRCSKIMANKFQPVLDLMGGGSTRKYFGNWTLGKSYAVGFTHHDFQMNGAIWRAGWRIKFHEVSDLFDLPDDVQIVESKQVNCPENHAICGQQNIFDRENKGILTNIFFKCCYYCTPKEKLMTIDSFKNMGPVDTTQKVELMVGATNKGNKFINPGDIQMYFSNWFHNYKFKYFDWTETWPSLFTEEEVKTINYVCPARHFCTIQQIMGTCGQVQVRTSYTRQDNTPLDLVEMTEMYKVPKKRIQRNDEWTLQNLISKQDHSGIWSSPQFCPLGAFVTNLLFKRILDMGISGLSLECSKINENGQIVQVSNLISGSEISFSSSDFIERNEPAIGFVCTKYSIDQSSCLDLELIYRDQPTSQVSETRCPQHHVVCGVQVLFDTIGLLKNLAPKCCPQCLPEERFVTLDLTTNLGNFDLVQNVQWTVGTKVHNGGKKDQWTPARIRGAFSSQFINSNLTSIFNWNQIPNSFFEKNQMMMTEYICPARHLCTLKQLRGFCGEDIEIFTAQVVREAFSFDRKLIA